MVKGALVNTTRGIGASARELVAPSAVDARIQGADLQRRAHAEHADRPRDRRDRLHQGVVDEGQLDQGLVDQGQLDLRVHHGRGRYRSHQGLVDQGELEYRLDEIAVPRVQQVATPIVQ